MALSRSRRRRLQICASNRMARRPDLLEQLRQKGYIVEVETCLDQCTRCEGCAFALVCGQFLFAPTPEELLQKMP